MNFLPDSLCKGQSHRLKKIYFRVQWRQVNFIILQKCNRVEFLTLWSELDKIVFISFLILGIIIVYNVIMVISHRSLLTLCDKHKNIFSSNDDFVLYTMNRVKSSLLNHHWYVCSSINLACTAVVINVFWREKWLS
jgi:hypothetical protein